MKPGGKLVFVDYHKPQPKLIWKFLPRAGLDLDRIRKDMHDPEITKIIQQAQALTLDIAGEANEQGMYGAPDHKVPGRPMPETGHQHGDPHVQFGFEASTLGPAERDIHIIAEPGGK